MFDFCHIVRKGLLLQKYSKFSFLPMCSVSLSTSLFSLLKLLTGHVVYKGFPCSLVGKESAYNAGDPGLIPGLGRYPGERNGNALQYSCLGNLMDRGAWQTTVHEVEEPGRLQSMRSQESDMT